MEWELEQYQSCSSCPSGKIQLINTSKLNTNQAQFT